MIKKLTVVLISALLFAVPVYSQENTGRSTDGQQSPVTSAHANLPSEFVRLQRDANQQPEVMQVAVVRLVPRNTKTSFAYVDLISAVHIGEHAYYAKVNQLFTQYDAVLYELVAPQGTRITNCGNKRKSVISGIQSWMRDILDMGFQLEDIDYQAANLVHADLSPEEFKKSMARRNESIAGMLGKAWMAGLLPKYRTKAMLSEIRMFQSILSGDRHRGMKIFMAEQMVESMKLGDIIEGSSGSTLVAARNKRAVEVLKEQIGSGRRKLAIFYGAAHMPDMGRRLINELDLVPADTRWLDAWDLRKQD